MLIKEQTLRWDGIPDNSGGFNLITQILKNGEPYLHVVRDRDVTGEEVEQLNNNKQGTLFGKRFSG